MIKKTTRIEIAKNTIEICERGFYINSWGKTASIKEPLAKAIQKFARNFSKLLFARYFCGLRHFGKQANL